MYKDGDEFISFFSKLAGSPSGSEDERCLTMQFSLAAYASTVAEVLSESIPKILTKFFMTEVRDYWRHA